MGVIPAHSAGASSGHRRWYGPKPPAAMVSGKRDVSCETEAKGGMVKYRSVRYIFYVAVKFINLRFIISIKLVDTYSRGKRGAEISFFPSHCKNY